MNRRTENLKNTLLAAEPELCAERALLLTAAWRETEGQPLLTRRAAGFARILRGMSIYIRPGELLVGNQASQPRAAPIFPEFGVAWLAREIGDLPTRRLDPFQVSAETRESLLPVIDYWQGKTHFDLVSSLNRQLLPDAALAAYDARVSSVNQVVSNFGRTSSGDGHVVASYARVIGTGFASLSEQAQSLLAARQFRGVRIARSLFLIPLMTPPIVVALTWRMLFNARFGYINYFLGLVGLPQLDWLGDPAWAMPSLIISDVWVSTPFVATIVLAGLLSLPEEPFEAATVDGASPVQIFWNITLPLLRPVIALAIMFRSIEAFRKFESIQIMTGGGPADVTMTVNFLVYNTGFLFLRLADASVLAIIMVALMFIIVVTCVRWLESE